MIHTDRGYPVAILSSLGLHGLLVVVAVIGWSSGPSEPRTPTPRYIEATLLEMEPRAPEPREDTAQQEAAREAAEQQRQQQARQEQQRREEERRAEQRRQEEQRQQQARREAEERQQREEAERRERERQEAERRRQEEMQRQQREEALARSMAEEDARRQAEAQAEVVGTYSDYIRNQIEANWSRPPSARRGMTVTLEIQLVPTGRVVGVTIAQSSGNEAVDRSAEQAVYRVGQFDRLQGMDSAIFERNFRRFRLQFQPADLRL